MKSFFSLDLYAIVIASLFANAANSALMAMYMSEDSALIFSIAIDIVLFRILDSLACNAVGSN